MMMRRREFMTLLGGAAAAWPIGAGAQKPVMPVIGLLGTTSREADARLAPFRQTLQQAGYVEKQNVAIEYRWAENEYDRFPALAADLTNPLYTNSFLKDLEAAASTLGAKLHLLHASTENDFDPAFEMLELLETGALVVGPDYFSSVAAIGSLRWLYAIPCVRSIHGARRQWRKG